MSNLIKRIKDTLRERNQFPDMPLLDDRIIPAIHRVELYLSFYGNDRCAHCVTRSGPHRTEVMHPDGAENIINNISRNSIISRLRAALDDGDFQCEQTESCRQLDAMKKPPKKLSKELKIRYTDCINGKGLNSVWHTGNDAVELNFGRPSIRLSGGEFSCWPHLLDGAKTNEIVRLYHQKDLIGTIRSLLPEYNIYILTNGRFAENEEKAESVISNWAGDETRGGKTRVCISVDNFHLPPKMSSIEQMLQRIWKACLKNGMSAPYLYGNTNNRIMLVGRAMELFGCCSVNDAKNSSDSNFNPVEDISLDPVSLVDTDGCPELRGFICTLRNGYSLVNNIVINPDGNLNFCCACVGDFGNFLEEPEASLRNILTDPIAAMLRKSVTAKRLLNTAVELDPAIKIYSSGTDAAVTGSTCYQVLSGVRGK